MGRMKEIFMEVQEQYGENLEEAPVDFSMDEYLAKRAAEISKYIQSIDCSFKDHKLSPYLLWTEKMVSELYEFNKRKLDFFKQFEKKKLIVSDGQLKLSTIRLIDTEEIKVISEIVDFSTPLLESKVKLGYKLLGKYPQILF